MLINVFFNYVIQCFLHVSVFILLYVLAKQIQRCCLQLRLKEMLDQKFDAISFLSTPTSSIIIQQVGQACVTCCLMELLHPFVWGIVLPAILLQHLNLSIPIKLTFLSKYAQVNYS